MPFAPSLLAAAPASSEAPATVFGATEPGPLNSSGALLAGVAVFLLLLYAAFIIYKYFLPGANKGFRKNKQLKILEITSVGPGSTIQLVRVSEEYFLIGVTKTSISFLSRVNSFADTLSEAGAVTLPPAENYADKETEVDIKTEKSEN